MKNELEGRIIVSGIGSEEEKKEEEFFRNGREGEDSASHYQSREIHKNMLKEKKRFIYWLRLYLTSISDEFTSTLIVINNNNNIRTRAAAATTVVTTPKCTPNIE